MVEHHNILEYVNQLARAFDPERVILFGSYARGNPTEDSDVDLLIVMDHQKRKNVEQAVEIDVKMHRSFPLDLIVRTPSEVKRRLGQGDVFLQAVFQEGEVLYERKHSGVAR